MSGQVLKACSVRLQAIRGTALPRHPAAHNDARQHAEYDPRDHVGQVVPRVGVDTIITAFSTTDAQFAIQRGCIEDAARSCTRWAPSHRHDPICRRSSCYGCNTTHAPRAQNEKPLDPSGSRGFVFWRRGWDSNPRYGETVRLISSQVHSTTLPPLLPCCFTAFRGWSFPRKKRL